MERQKYFLICLALIVSIFTGQSVLAVEYSYTTIDYQNATGTWVYGINDDSDIVGHYYDSTGRQHGFSRIGDSFSTIDYFDASPTVANGINNSGQIAGYYWDGSNYVSFLYDGGSFTTIGYPSGADRIFAHDINDASEIVGWYGPGPHGFSLGSSLMPIDVPSASGTHAYGINNIGQIVGSYTDASGEHGYLLTGDNNFLPIDFPSSSITKLVGINDTGQVVGSYQDASLIYHSFFMMGLASARLMSPELSRPLSMILIIPVRLWDGTGMLVDSMVLSVRLFLNL